MPRKKKNSLKTRARKMAERRKQETPEERALRLENMRLYAKNRRANETPAKRRERLCAMRNYARRVRQQQIVDERKQKFAMIEQRLKVEQELESFEDVPPHYFVNVEIVEDDYVIH